MLKCALALLAATTAFAQYKAAPAEAPPSELAAPISAELQSTGQKITAPDGKVWCEVWFRKALPAGFTSTESDVTWKSVPIGTLLGAIRFPAAGLDRRGQPIKPGVYTLRYGNYPINGDHQGVAPQRDFLVLTPAAVDQDPKQVAKFDDLMNMSRKASGGPHPAVLSMWLVESDFQPGLELMGEHDWVLKTTIGNAKVAVILVGKAEG